MTATLDLGSVDADLLYAINDAFRAAHVSVTGTRHRMPAVQITALTFVLGGLHASGPRILHHGLCKNADEHAHRLALGHGWQIHGHPGPRPRWQMPVNPAEFTVLHPEKPFRDRDADMAEACSRLVAAPAFPERHPRSRRSGTWLTVRLARNLGRPITFAWPNGTITSEGDPST